MLSSFLIRLGMLVATMGVVFWIGWAVPHSHSTGSGQEETILESNEKPFSPGGQLTVSELAVSDRQSASKGDSSHASGIVDLNNASEEEIEALPGIGPVLAERIVKYRQSRGAFRDIDQLRNVKGIGEKKFNRIRTRVYVVPQAVPTRKGRKAT